MKLQLKRSNVLEGGFAKQPTGAQMEFGELAVNYNLDDPCIFIKDSGNNIIRISNAGIPISGDINLQPGTLDERYLMLTGGTMTGSITLSTNSPVADLEAASKGYVDNQITLIDIPAAPDTSPSPPSTPESGQLWWNTNDGRLYIYYNDIDSSQWVPATPETGGGVSELITDGGLQINDDFEIGILVDPGKGIATSESGVRIGDDWSNIPTLPTD